MLCKVNECKNHDKLKPSTVFKMERDHYKPETCGIVTRQFLKGFALEMAEKIKQPLLILQKKPQGCNCNVMAKRQKQCKLFADDSKKCSQEICVELSEKSKYSRLEVVEVQFSNYSPLCRYIRLDHKDYERNVCRCINKDNLAAGYFLGSEEDRQKAERELNPTLYLDERGNYIKYVCDYSKLTEFAFEVCIGINDLKLVIIFGQFLLDDGTPAGIQAKEDHHKIVDDFNAGIKDNDDQPKLKPNEPITLENLETAVEVVYESISALKERIEKLYEVRLKAIISDKLSVDIPKIAEKVDWKYDELKNKVRSLISGFAKKAEFGAISCFMTEYLDEFYGTHLTNEDNIKIQTGFFAHDSLDVKLVEIDSLEDNKKFLAHIPDLEKYSHIIFISNEHQFNILVLAQVKKCGKGYDELLIDQCGEYFKIMLYVIRGVASSLFSKHKKESVDNFTTDLRHELGQSNMGILGTVSYFEKTCGELMEDSLVSNLIKDARGYAFNTMIRANTSRYMDGVPTLDKRNFYPFSAFLYKWKHVYDDMMRLSGLNYKFAKLTKHEDENGSFVRDFSRPYMFADKDMIEQVAYNLTNNAIKYSLPGTTVSMDCRLSDDKKWYLLTVISYGISLEDGEYESIFERGVQGSNAKFVKDDSPEHKDSVGVGLALSRKIAKAHKGDLILDYHKISNLCAPFFCAYLEQYDTALSVLSHEMYKLKDLRSDINKEIVRLKQDYKEWWGEMNAGIPQTSKGYKSPYSIFNSINKGVTRYAFKLLIPYGRKDV